MASVHTIEVQLKFLQAVGSNIAGINQQTERLQGRMSTLGRTLTSGLAFGAMERFGEAGKKAFGSIIDQATLLQSALARVQIATVASSDAMRDYKNLITTTSSRYSMDTSQAANMVAVAARTGMSRATIMSTFDSIAKFASIQQFERGIDYESSAKLAATTARLFGARTPEQTETVLNNLYRAMNTTPMAPNQILTSLQNFAPVGMQLGMSQEETFQAAALMGTMGLGSKGGTGLFNMLMRSVGKTASLTGHREDKQMHALHELGIKTGGPANFKDLVHQLVLKSVEMGSKGQSARFIQDVIAAFNDRGGRVAAALSTKDAQDNLMDLLKGWQQTTDLTAAMNVEQKTLAFQTGVVSSNFRMLQSTIGDTATKTMPHFQERLAAWIAAFDAKVKGSPALQSVLGGVVLGGEGASSAMTVLGKLGMALNFVNQLRGTVGQFTGKGGGGMPVAVTNWPSNFGGGLGGGLGSSLGGLAGAAGGAVGGASVAMIASVVGVALAAEGGLVGLAYLLKKSLDSDLDAAKNRANPKVAPPAAMSTGKGGISGLAGTGVLSEADQAKFKATGHGEIHINGGSFVVNANDPQALGEGLRKAANRHSGKSVTSPSHSPKSGYGGS